MKEDHGSYKPIRLDVKSSGIFVRVRKGDLVALRLHNTSQYDAAVGVLIDGLSRFALSEDVHKKNSLDLVTHGAPRIIKGYYLNEHHVDAFRVGEYSKSVAAELLPHANASGTVTIAFRAAWKENETEPPNESSGLHKRTIGMERGPQRQDKTRHVKRRIGDVRAVIKIFYGE